MKKKNGTKRKIKIPKILRIGPHDVKVNYPYDFKERDDCCGVAKLRTNEIFLIDRDGHDIYPDSKIEEALLHEIMHFVTINTVGVSALFDDEDKHNAVCVMLLQVLKDNDIDFRGRG